MKKRKLPLVFSSLGRPDGKSFFIRLEAALHICRPRCLMNTEAGRAVASLILHRRGEPSRPGCVIAPPPTAALEQNVALRRVLWARRRQLAPRRNKAAALCWPNASLCCHLRSLLVLIDTIGATSPPKHPNPRLSTPVSQKHPRPPSVTSLLTAASNRWPAGGLVAPPPPEGKETAASPDPR